MFSIMIIILTFNINITIASFNIIIISKFMAYNVQALQSISLVHVQKVCLLVLL